VNLKGDKLVTAGTDGVVFEITHKATDLKKAQLDINTCIKDDVRLSGKQVRSDMFERYLKDAPELKKLGYYILEV